MRVAQGAQHGLHQRGGLPAIVDADAGGIRWQAAALGADATEGRQRSGRRIQPLRLAADAKAGRVHVLAGHPQRNRAVSAKPRRRFAEARLILVMAAAESSTRERSAIGAARRSSGGN